MKLLAGFAYATLLFSTSAASALTFNAANDFSIVSNPNGAWSYGYSTMLGGVFVPFTASGTNIVGAANPNFNYWEIGSAPLVFKNTAATNQLGGISVNLDPGQLAFHPGPLGEIALVRWTAPSADSILLNTLFSGRDTIGTTTDVHIFLNGVALFNGLINGFGAATSFVSTLAVAQGDIIDFAVGYGTNATYFADSTGLSATISSVPEPATLLLFGVALAGWAGIRRKNTLIG